MGINVRLSIDVKKQDAEQALKSFEASFNKFFKKLSVRGAKGRFIKAPKIKLEIDKKSKKDVEKDAKKIGERAGKGFSRGFKRFAKFNIGIGSALKTLNLQVSAVVTALNQFRDLVQSLSGLAIRVFAGAVRTIAAGFKALRDGIIEPTESFRRFTVVLTGALKSTSRAREIANFAQRFAAISPFTQQDIEEVIRLLAILPATAHKLRQVSFSKVRMELVDLLETIQGMAAIDPRGIQSAMIAFAEGVGGTIQSVRRRLNISVAALSEISGVPADEIRRGGEGFIKAMKQFTQKILGPTTFQELARLFSVQADNVVEALRIGARRIGEKGVFDFITDSVTRAADTIRNIALGEEFVEIAEKVSASLEVLVKNVVRGIGRFLAAIFQVPDAMRKAFAADPLEVSIETMVKLIEQLAKQSEKLPALLDKVGTRIRETIRSIITGVVKVLEFELWGDVRAIFSSGFAFLKLAAVDLFDIFFTVISKMATAIPFALVKIFEKIVEGLKIAIQKIKELAQERFVRDVIPESWTKGLESAEKAVGRFQKTVGSFADDLGDFNLGDIIADKVFGINLDFERQVAAVNIMAKSIRFALKGIFPFSGQDEEARKDLVRKFVDDMFVELRLAFRRIMPGGIAEVSEDLRPKAREAFRKIFASIQEAQEFAAEFGFDLTNRVKRKFQEFGENFRKQLLLAAGTEGLLDSKTILELFIGKEGDVNASVDAVVARMGHAFERGAKNIVTQARERFAGTILGAGGLDDMLRSMGKFSERAASAQKKQTKLVSEMKKAAGDTIETLARGALIIAKGSGERETDVGVVFKALFGTNLKRKLREASTEFAVTAQRLVGKGKEVIQTISKIDLFDLRDEEAQKRYVKLFDDTWTTVIRRVLAGKSAVELVDKAVITLGDSFSKEAEQARERMGVFNKFVGALGDTWLTQIPGAKKVFDVLEKGSAKAVRELRFLPGLGEAVSQIRAAGVALDEYQNKALQTSIMEDTFATEQKKHALTRKNAIQLLAQLQAQLALSAGAEGKTPEDRARILGGYTKQLIDHIKSPKFQSDLTKALSETGEKGFKFSPRAIVQAQKEWTKFFLGIFTGDLKFLQEAADKGLGGVTQHIVNEVAIQRANIVLVKLARSYDLVTDQLVAAAGTLNDWSARVEITSKILSTANERDAAGMQKSSQALKALTSSVRAAAFSESDFRKEIEAVSGAARDKTVAKRTQEIVLSNRELDAILEAVNRKIANQVVQNKLQRAELGLLFKALKDAREENEKNLKAIQTIVAATAFKDLVSQFRVLRKEMQGLTGVRDLIDESFGTDTVRLIRNLEDALLDMRQRGVLAAKQFENIATDAARAKFLEALNMIGKIDAELSRLVTHMSEGTAAGILGLTNLAPRVDALTNAFRILGHSVSAVFDPIQKLDALFELNRLKTIVNAFARIRERRERERQAFERSLRGETFDPRVHGAAPGEPTGFEPGIVFADFGAEMFEATSTSFAGGLNAGLNEWLGGEGPRTLRTFFESLANTMAESMMQAIISGLTERVTTIIFGNLLEDLALFRSKGSELLSSMSSAGTAVSTGILTAGQTVATALIAAGSKVAAAIASAAASASVSSSVSSVSSLMQVLPSIAAISSGSGAAPTGPEGVRGFGLGDSPILLRKLGGIIPMLRGGRSYGVADKPTFVYGEKTPEAFIPLTARGQVPIRSTSRGLEVMLPGGRSIPVDFEMKAMERGGVIGSRARDPAKPSSDKDIAITVVNVLDAEQAVELGLANRPDVIFNHIFKDADERGPLLQTIRRSLRGG